MTPKVPVFGDASWIACANPPKTGKPLRKRGQPWYEIRGPGPVGKRCRDCKHLRIVQRSNRFFKCGLVKITHGPGTDIRYRDFACKLFEES